MVAAQNVTMSALTALAAQLSEDITEIESRKSKRAAAENERFIYSLTKILTDVWEGIHVSPNYECVISRKNNSYF